MSVTDTHSRPGSPGSATLVVLQAYDNLATQNGPSQTAGHPQLEAVEDKDPADSSSRSNARLSTISFSSTVNLVPPHADTSGSYLHREFKESPFRWNYPSLPELPVDQEQLDLQSIASQRKKPALRMWHGWKVILYSSWLNLLLLLMPITWVCTLVMGKHHHVVFVLSILSMIPLVKLHDLSIRELAIRFGGSKTGLLNASMSNTVELVVAVTALRKCELHVVQSSLIGSMLSKLLLILGMCFFAGGLRFSEQGFDQTATQTHCSLLSISVGALLLPAVYHFALSGAQESNVAEQKRDILKMSHGVSIVLIFIYLFYLLFQFWSHRHLYKDMEQKSNRLSVRIPINTRFITERRIFSGEFLKTSRSYPDVLRWRSSSVSTGSRMDSFVEAASGRFSLHSPSEATLATSSFIGPINAEKTNDSHPTIRLVTQNLKDQRVHPPSGTSGMPLPRRPRWQSEDEASTVNDTCNIPEPVGTTVLSPLSQDSKPPSEPLKEPRLSLTLTLLLLTTVTILATFNAEELVESMDGIAMSISKQWVGLILLPAVSSIAECVTAMNVSVKDQLGLSISVAVGSAIQTTLLIIPFMVTLGWALNKPLPLLFDPFEAIVLYISVQTMSHVVADGKSNWLDGAILISLYVVIAVSFWYYPGQLSDVAVCVMSMTANG